MIAGYIGIAAAVAIAGAGIYAWDADKALDRTRKALTTAELQKDQFAKGLTQCRLDIRERNKTLAGMTALPVVRKQLCAVQGPASPCCTPDKECKP